MNDWVSRKEVTDELRLILESGGFDRESMLFQYCKIERLGGEVELGRVWRKARGLFLHARFGEGAEALNPLWKGLLC